MPLRVPALDLQTAHQCDIDLQGIIQSGRNVIMSSCRNVIMPLRILQGNAVYGLKEIVYIINIIYTISLTSHIPLFLNGMMT